ncbi:MAG: DUF1259 domain-containing protein [Gemmatimonadetes bacterium]|nr:DUF1259 domain-containing protein [Gemmatimonadota bacterium]
MTVRKSLLAGVLVISSASVVRAQTVDWKAVEAAIGRPGVQQAGTVYRFAFPRGDLHVTIGDLELKPALALGGWVAFMPAEGGAVAMGDLVLTDDEVTPVITALQAGGVEQTAIHHHVLHETPTVYYVHVHAHGDPVKIAEAVRAAVSLTKTPPPAAPGTPVPLSLDTALLVKRLGYAGRGNGGAYQVGVPRMEIVRDGGIEIPPTMGLATAINFQPTGTGRAVATGDFVLVATEVNSVIRALRAGGVEVTSLHSHLLGEEPRLLFMHFWGNDDVEKLAGVLRSALDLTNSRRPAS